MPPSELEASSTGIRRCSSSAAPIVTQFVTQQAELAEHEPGLPLLRLSWPPESYGRGDRHGACARLVVADPAYDSAFVLVGYGRMLPRDVHFRVMPAQQPRYSIGHKGTLRRLGRGDRVSWPS
jgi:hypothetical protein